MDDRVDGNDGIRPLAQLGIGDLGESAYRALLERHAATAAEIADQLAIAPGVAEQQLDGLEDLGLATHMPKIPPVYVAAPPEFAITALVRRRQASLEEVRVAIPDLERQSARAYHGAGHEPVFESITSRTELGVVLGQLYRSVRKEVMAFQRAPFLLPAVSPSTMTVSGGGVRTISDSTALEVPGALAQVQKDAARGEQARMVPVLPFKMMIFDRSAALIALAGTRAEAPTTMLVHGGALVTMLCELFEFVWEHATPICFKRPGKDSTARALPHANQVEDALLPLLAAGLNDKLIASELGISAATLSRRISELMRIHGAKTRFQLGWSAALAAQPPRS